MHLIVSRPCNCSALKTSANMSSRNLCDYDTSHSCNAWPFSIACTRPPDDAPRPAFGIVLLEQVDNKALGGGGGVEQLNNM
jgi:hypothetical protein